MRDNATFCLGSLRGATRPKSTFVCHYCCGANQPPFRLTLRPIDFFLGAALSMPNALPKQKLMEETNDMQLLLLLVQFNRDNASVVHRCFFVLWKYVYKNCKAAAQQCCCSIRCRFHNTDDITPPCSPPPLLLLSRGQRMMFCPALCCCGVGVQAVNDFMKRSDIETFVLEIVEAMRRHREVDAVQYSCAGLCAKLSEVGKAQLPCIPSCPPRVSHHHGNCPLLPCSFVHHDWPVVQV